MTAAHRLSGMIGPPLVWSINTQLGQILPYADCVTRLTWSGLSSACACLLAIIASGFSFAAVKRSAGTNQFIAGASGLVGLAVTFALLLQTTATVMIDPCAR